MSAQQTPGPKKPTPAQTAWLRAIDAGFVYRGGHSWVNGMRNTRGHSFGCPNRSTYVMTCALRDAGWIDQAGVPDGPFRDHYPLVLTEAGRTAIAANGSTHV